MSKYTKENPRVVRLSETTGMLHRIASAVIAVHGEYRCMVEDVPTLVVER